jgi:hypothetical protein
MTLDINTLAIGQRVQLPEGETGTIRRIDYDDYMIYVAVPVANGEDIADVSVDEPDLKLA